jgi:hypothetical protein
MNELTEKLERLLSAKAINIETKEAGRIRYKGSKILPLAKSEEPKIGDFCRSIVVGKDEAKKELILHLTYLLDGEKSTFLNHLKFKGYIRDYDLVKMLATNIEIRIFHLHLHRQFQTSRSRFRTRGANSKHLHQR